ncbi:MAG TPA: hypothetical protein VM367_13945 [Pseudonocardia sp.]|jgi:hypothetical protein|nr:hypothetical protein [Pseudonocardia sp.]
MTEDAQLPLPGYDHLPVGSLAHRIRALDAHDLTVILDHERAHADRFNVVQLLTQRLDALRAGDAEPSGGDPAAAQPEQAPPPDGRSPGNASATPDNNQPLRHGVAGQTPNRSIRAR